ncbi:sugar phosphate isomerase/epimerase family protein [Cyclobacterium marinum]|uniref:Xylose isomerase domain-containing protein TIM barrel n=1 Tax=Cyclobacterium marinum (strain ATCC 25205 / DSM 745 / LMG 13164 / NCIMB 1802) TaxID=880070 RepID=G0J498_CYCMS|nr:sugar phosphate isomerase/epimerase [Cyclobacterium marinum]AEL27524.1 Xylose isomerase domain-containing protein TIM barrel [Cyclobacterium marinum DSM 745]MBI0397296.1 sugar phosphate isomerase/epimerase [Cyclobacterium marinum]MBR9775696.1 sugar phosphate isomerase/epimerase [Cytophagales bacterium]
MNNKSFKLGLLSLFLMLSFHIQAQEGMPKGWKVGSQAYTFRLFSLEETLEKLNSIGVKYVEMYPGQKISKSGNETTDFTSITADGKAKIKALLNKYDIEAVAYGVVNASDEDLPKLFDFAKELGIGILTSESKPNQFDQIEKLCEEYQIKLALHNHPVPSYYWHPEVASRMLEGRSELMGVCADIGHWVRSGLNPVDCLKQLEGRIISLHIKDLNKFGVRDAHDLPWGTGTSNVAGVLHELHRQGFEGAFSAEYEHNWENNLPDVEESIAYFKRVAAQL